MPTILVDVDLTVVRTDLQWLDWLNRRSWWRKSKSTAECGYDYNLGNHFPWVKDPWDFWRLPNLYDDLEPVEGCACALRDLKDAGYDIVFASYCKAGHFKSKYEFLKKHFPFMGGFHATKEKHQIKADWFIDDRNEFLNKRNDGCNLIKFHTPYTQTEENLNKAASLTNWDSIKTVIMESRGE
jgi:5'(3')-deoxyribonucleotidase